MARTDDNLGSHDSRHGESAPLTNPAFWDSRWYSTALPVVAARGGTRLGDELLNALDICFSGMRGAQVLEIGGAPGGYLAYLAETHGLQATAIDYSPTGCLKLRENFRMLELDVTVHQLDVFDADATSSEYDAVYSLGFVEHFAHVQQALDAHIRLVRPGGLVVIGAPYMAGPYGLALTMLGPDVLKTHNPRGTRLDVWDAHLAARGLRKEAAWRLGGLSLGAISGALQGVSLRGARLQGRRGVEFAARMQNAAYRAGMRSPLRAGSRRILVPGWEAYSLVAYRR